MILCEFCETNKVGCDIFPDDDGCEYEGDDEAVLDTLRNMGYLMSIDGRNRMKMRDIPKTKPCEKCGADWWDVGHMEYVNGKWTKFMVCTNCGNEVSYETTDDVREE